MLENLCTPLLVMLTQGDVFNPAYTEGNINRISSFASVFGVACQWIISIVGFGIVMASIAKNAINGLYAVNPKLFDRVDEIRRAGLEASKNVKGMGGGNVAASTVMKGLGSILYGLCALIPNIKAMSDFDEADARSMDAKAYFMRSIPLLCLQIFIGVFIFFGYPSKVAAYISDFGTGTLDVVLTNVDPGAWVESLPGKMAKINFATDNAPDSLGQAANKIANSAYRSVVGYYKDITKERRQEVAETVEKYVIGERERFSQLCDDDKYNLSCYTSIVAYDPAETIKILNGNTGAGAVSQDGVVTYGFAKEMSMILQEGVTTEQVAGKYLFVQLTFTPKAMKGNNSAVVNWASVSKKAGVGNEKEIYLSGPASSDSSSVGAEFTSIGATGKITNSENKEVVVKIEAQDGGAVLKVYASDGKSNIAGGGYVISGITNLYYKYDGKSHPIDKITITSGSAAATFVPVNGETYNTWTWGNGPTKREQGAPSATTGGMQGPMNGNQNSLNSGGLH